MIMEKNILVAYATKYGATAEIAEKIGEVLREEDLGPDILPVKKVGDLEDYQAIIVGSAVYIGRWRKEAVIFLKDNEKTLAQKPVWVFSSGPTGEGDAVELLDGWQIPGAVENTVKRIQPRDIAVFHGDVDVEKLNFIERSMVKNVEAPVGDFRDWEAITAWAASIVEVLKEDVVT
jgi:menaquinone-dependent protoporphyrinogen oxidase